MQCNKEMLRTIFSSWWSLDIFVNKYDVSGAGPCWAPSIRTRAIAVFETRGIFTMSKEFSCWNVTKSLRLCSRSDVSPARKIFWATNRSWALYCVVGPRTREEFLGTFVYAQRVCADARGKARLWSESLFVCLIFCAECWRFDYRIVSSLRFEKGTCQVAKYCDRETDVSGKLNKRRLGWISRAPKENCAGPWWKS